MTDHEKSVFDGIATGLGFIGMLGFAVNSNYWPALITMIAVAIYIPLLVRKDDNE